MHCQAVLANELLLSLHYRSVHTSYISTVSVHATQLTALFPCVMLLLLASKQVMVILLVVGLACSALTVRARSSTSTAERQEPSSGTAEGAATELTSVQPKVKLLLQAISASNRAVVRVTVITVEYRYILISAVATVHVRFCCSCVTCVPPCDRLLSRHQLRAQH
jgi:hypothetical protein